MRDKGSHEADRAAETVRPRPMPPETHAARDPLPPLALRPKPAWDPSVPQDPHTPYGEHHGRGSTGPARPLCRPAARRLDRRRRARPLDGRFGRARRRRRRVRQPARHRAPHPPADLAVPGDAGVLPGGRVRERGVPGQSTPRHHPGMDPPARAAAAPARDHRDRRRAGGAPPRPSPRRRRPRPQRHLGRRDPALVPRGLPRGPPRLTVGGGRTPALGVGRRPRPRGRGRPRRHPPADHGQYRARLRQLRPRLAGHSPGGHHLARRRPAHHSARRRRAPRRRPGDGAAPGGSRPVRRGHGRRRDPARPLEYRATHPRPPRARRRADRRGAAAAPARDGLGGPSPGLGPRGARQPRDPHRLPLAHGRARDRGIRAGGHGPPPCPGRGVSGLVGVADPVDRRALARARAPRGPARPRRGGRPAARHRATVRRRGGSGARDGAHRARGARGDRHRGSRSATRRHPGGRGGARPRRARHARAGATPPGTRREVAQPGA